MSLFEINIFLFCFPQEHELESEVEYELEKEFVEGDIEESDDESVQLAEDETAHESDVDIEVSNCNRTNIF